jgi:hypothetical protein
MTVHEACRPVFEKLVREFVKRAEMDESVFRLIPKTYPARFENMRKAIDVAMNEQYWKIQDALWDVLQCECPIYWEEAKMKKVVLAKGRK